MAPTVRTSRARTAHAEHLVRAIVGGIVAIIGYAGTTTGAVGPAFGSLAEAERPRQAATLVRSGADVTIAGAVDIFASASFTGPNRAEKRDRLLPSPDVMAVSGVFDDIRARIAALRLPAAAEPVVAGPAPAPAPVATSIPKSAPLQVAALGGDVASAALSAIDEAALGGGPLPVRQSSQLSYARAELPKTMFDGTARDRRGREVSAKELNCLATAIYFEARGESYRGQIAVGQVVMNRVQHRLYPTTICGVVFQNQNRRNACQFSFACDGIPERINEPKAWAQAEQIAKGVVSGQLYLDEVGYATHYHATYVRPHWAPRMKRLTKVGLHVFYQFKRGWKFG